MILGVVICATVGIACTVLGFLIWKKERITLLHDYHADKVSDEDKKAFCTLSGIGIVLVGIGLIMTALLLAFTESALSFLAFAAGFAAGLVLLITAGVKYNR